MSGATVVTWSRMGFGSAILPLAVGILAAFVVWGRLGWGK
jgi:hypothetical protein